MDLTEINQSSYSIVQRHPWERARVRIVKHLLEAYIVNGRKIAVADIGCGDLFVAHYLVEQFSEISVYAVDIAFTDSQIDSYNKIHERIKAFKTTDEINHLNINIDIVLLLDVIEHIEYEKNYVTSLIQNKFISKETICIITVPAFQTLYTNHDIFLQHFRRYTKKHLKSTLTQAGLHTLNSKYFFFSLFLFRSILKFKEILFTNNHKKEEGVGNWQGSKIMGIILTSILLIDYHITRILTKTGISLPGLSVYSICKRFVS